MIIHWFLSRLKYNSSIKDRTLFYAILLKELIFLPFWYIYEEIKKSISSLHFEIKNKYRNPVVSDQIEVCVHEWAGYKPVRSKIIRNDIKEFECGLHYQLIRFQEYAGKHTLNFNLTISEKTRYDYHVADGVNFIEVSNNGFDFAGYAAFYRSIIENDKVNKYVLLSNTSIQKSIDPFLDDFIKIMENNPEIGLLGISYNTKIYQSFIRNNFNPHISSFFLLTTSDVLKEVVKANNHKFPGDGITHKLLLIRYGEIKLSQLVLKLGYKLAVVLNDGNLYTFNSRGFLNNGYASWKLPHGDYRLHCETPNKITAPAESL